MQIRLALMFIALLCAPCALRAQVPSVAADNSYDTLLAKLTAGDVRIDFTALRLAYSRSKNADPYGADHDKRRQMSAAVIENRCDEAMKVADDILAGIYLSPDTHAAKSSCYRAGGDNAKADLHKAIYLGLITSILAKGDGNSAETAYSIVTIEEEYAVMRALGFAVWAQEYVHKGEHTFEVLSGTDDRNKRTAKVYFNVDIPISIEKQRKALKQ